MKAAMVDMDRAAMVVWLTPTMMVRLAIGSCTLVSSWDRLDPIDVVASMVATEMLRMPYAGVRWPGGRGPAGSRRRRALQGGDGDAAVAVRSDADARRDGVDHRGDARRCRADAE